MSFYKNQQKSVHFRSRTLFCFFKKNSVESNAKKHIIFSEKIGEKSDKKMVKKKLKKNSFKKVVKTRSKKWSKLVQKEKKREAEKIERNFDKKTKSLGITRV